MLGAPSPRFRIYTAPAVYARALGELISGAVYKGDDAETLEGAVKKLTGSKHALCAPTARAAIYLTLLGTIKPGQEVVLSPLTIVDVVNMVLAAGGKPVFADIESRTCNIAAERVEAAINARTGAVLVTHLHGLACEIEKIRDLCARRGVALIEDAAQSFSTRVRGRWTGTFGRAGVFSFGMYKIVNAFYGGMIVTEDDALARFCEERLASWPFMSRSALLHKIAFAAATDLSTAPAAFWATYRLFRWGFLHDVEAINGMVTVDRFPRRDDRIRPELLCRMSPLQARLILGQFGRVEENNRARIAAAKLYHEGLSSLEGILLPPWREDGSHIYTYYAFRCPDRREFVKFALRRGRDLVLSHYHDCAGLEIFKEFQRDCPQATATASELVYLPTYPRYPKSEILENIEVVRDYFRSRARS